MRYVVIKTRQPDWQLIRSRECPFDLKEILVGEVGMNGKILKRVYQPLQVISSRMNECALSLLACDKSAVYCL